MEVTVMTTNEKFQSELSDVIQLFQNGLMTLHLRKSRFSTKKLREYIESIPKSYHNRIIIHSHHRLALKYRLKGIHISKNHRKKSLKLFFKLMYYRMRRPGIVITRTFHSIDSLQNNRGRYSYVFLNPVFSKINPIKNAFDVNEQHFCKLISENGSPVFASGNIVAENIHLLHRYPFAGMVLTKFLWEPESSLKKTELYLSVVDSFSALDKAAAKNTQ